jgi:hypothetical protein
MGTLEVNEMRQLDRRINDGYDVRLLWDADTGRVFVSVDAAREDASFLFEVDGAEALEAFEHPFAFVSGDPDARPPTLSQRAPSSPTSD